jgi:DNA primase
VKDIIQKYEKSWARTNKIRSEINFYSDKNHEAYDTKEKLNMPKFVSKIPMNVHLSYLKKRRFDPEEVIEKYDLWFGNTVGFYRHSIIIPVYSNGIPVCFVATDCTRKRYTYNKSPDVVNVEKHSEVLYNYDKNMKKVMLVEGVFDAWRVNGVALLTKNITPKQLLKIRGKEVDIFLDPDAWEEAARIAGMIYWTVPNLILSDTRDPADL